MISATRERVWGIGRMIVTGETEVPGVKSMTVPFCTPQILLGLHRTESRLENAVTKDAATVRVI